MRKTNWDNINKIVAIALSIGLVIALVIMVFAFINLTKANASSKAFRDTLTESYGIESNQ
ncbi:MAG: hypothetical protein PHD38_02465 [Mesotoga sp.]|jgi:uncharacterized membrane protein YukC|uniref:hypothetical protein n=1 Tax=unclassified Mesotoga TaxID=1184398 RepID=UPI000EF15190|nr:MULTISPECIES: hypothetical protein [unclassified Mesotoga]MDI9367517.1 hypothetical protein [Thermotogota bacterium]NLT43984.1 hypothetical protein [Thermotogaceae bacterium]MDD2333248.1 hypothetical protein [Mesotoga sp.]MDD3681213.1 hypothetical protein [Mesotoga sp.]MDD4825143.1 hypothetical protein [Mesotoga sp.]